MPAILASLLGGLLSLVSTFIGRALVALGIGFVSYSGFDATLGYLKQSAFTAFQGLPAETLGLVGYLGIGSFINMICSAYIARLTINGILSGTIKKMVFK